LISVSACVNIAATQYAKIVGIVMANIQSVIKESWWIRYYILGKQIREDILGREVLKQNFS
jgi:hypothetical protein